MSKPIFEIDGAAFSTLEEFYSEVERVLIPGTYWGRNLDAFNDILRGRFGTPEGGFIIHWCNAALSRERLGPAESVRQIQRRLKKCHPSNRLQIEHELEQAQRGEGPTMFDLLVEIIRDHGPDGSEAEGGVELILEGI